MNGAKAIKMDNNADKYYIFPEIVEIFKFSVPIFPFPASSLIL